MNAQSAQTELKVSLIIAAVLSSACIVSTLAIASTPEESQLLSDIAKDGMLEVQLGKIASTQARSDKVREFGQHMVRDHSKANDKLKVAAKKDNIDLPGEISSDQQKKKDDLANLKGAAFDSEYMKAMVAGHEKAVAAVEKEVKNGTGAPKDWAVQTLPIIQAHKADAVKISAELQSGTTH